MTNKRPIWIGVDPGKSGAIAVLSKQCPPEVCKLDQPDTAIAAWLADQITPWVSAEAVIEDVHAFPTDSRNRAFSFGRSFGFLAGLLIAHDVVPTYWRPEDWQRVLRCRTGGDKRITRDKAARMFPQVKVIHATADALLLAHLCQITSKARS